MTSPAPSNIIITIGRSFGSGGRELGRVLAAKLGIPFYDKELLLQAAADAGVCLEWFERNDERAPQFFGSGMAFSFGLNPMPWYAGASSIGDDSLYHAQSQVILDLARRGSCVIVGRSADYVLRSEPGAVSVFVSAPMEACVARIMRRNDCATADQARRMAEKVNRLRANYYNFYTDKRWGASESYDLCIDSSRMPMELTAQAVIEYLKLRFPASPLLSR